MNEPTHMTVQRIYDEDGSHIEPPLDESWDDLTKLRWQAGSVRADTGIRIEVHPNGGGMSYWVGNRLVPGMYGLVVHGELSSISAMHDYHSAWVYMNGIATGVEVMRGE